MELKFTVDTEDLYGENGFDFETLLTDALNKKVIKNCSGELAGEHFKEFARLASDTIIAGVKLKMEGFLSEEIALTEGWGKPTFVGSIEDLIKKRFDDVLLRAVDSGGKTLKGCTSSSKTWIEWRIEEMLGQHLTRHLETASSNIDKATRKQVNEKIIEIKDSALKEHVDNAFTVMLKKA